MSVQKGAMTAARSKRQDVRGSHRMGKTIIKGLSRRQFVGSGLGLAAGLALAGQARAQAALTKEAVNYVDATPNPEQICGNCVFWVPGAEPEGVGACQMVQGEIAYEGWCSISTPVLSKSPPSGRGVTTPAFTTPGSD